MRQYFRFFQARGDIIFIEFWGSQEHVIAHLACSCQDKFVTAILVGEGDGRVFQYHSKRGSPVDHLTLQELNKELLT